MACIHVHICILAMFGQANFVVANFRSKTREQPCSFIGRKGPNGKKTCLPDTETKSSHKSSLKRLNKNPQRQKSLCCVLRVQSSPSDLRDGMAVHFIMASELKERESAI